jgi:hypothetical protein
MARRVQWPSAPSLSWSASMLDLVFVAATIGCFAAAFAYARACDRV